MKLVSIVVPSFNYVNFLSQCLESIQTQSYPKFEVLICDGGSTDGSLGEMFGQVTAEHLSYETLVVCLDTSGLRDIVLQAKTEMVASAFDVKSLMDLPSFND